MMKRAAVAIAILTILALPAKSASPADLVAEAKAAMEELRADPAKAVVAGLRAWSSLISVTAMFPESEVAAAVRSGDSSLGITHFQIEAALVDALADDILAMDDEVISRLPEEATRQLVEALLKNGRHDDVLELLGRVNYEQRPALRRLALADFVRRGNVKTALTVAQYDLWLHDEICRLLLAAKGPAAALQAVEKIEYGDGNLSVKLATLAEIARSGSEDMASVDQAAANQALGVLKDIVAGRDHADQATVIVLATLGLAEAAQRLADPGDLPIVIRTLALNGFFAEAKSLVQTGDSNRTAALVLIAMEQSWRGDAVAAEATLELIERNEDNAGEVAVAYARIGLLEKAARIASEGAGDEAWPTILGAVAAKQGVDAARSMAKKYDIDAEAVAEEIALGVSLRNPAEAIGLAGDNGKLLFTMAQLLVARGNYSAALEVLSFALKVTEPSDGYPGKFRAEVHELGFDIAMRLGDLTLAKSHLPDTWGGDDDRWSAFLAAQLRAGLFDDAAKSVELLPIRNSYGDNSMTQAEGWWQVATALASERGLAAATRLLDDKFRTDLATYYPNRWGKVLVASRELVALGELISGLPADDHPTRAMFEIAILSQI